MRKAMRMIMDMAKVCILFTGCTLLFYFAMLWIHEEYRSYHQYEKPKGESVEEVSGSNRENWIDRMVFFYENGE